MAELHDQWGDEEVQDSPAPTKTPTVALWVAGREVWRGDVTLELRAWARWCALQVVDLWDCVPVVRRYLETGNKSLEKTIHGLDWQSHRDTTGAMAEAIRASRFAVPIRFFDPSQAAQLASSSARRASIHHEAGSSWATTSGPSSSAAPCPRNSGRSSTATSACCAMRCWRGEVVELRYRWDSHPSQESPTPPKAKTVALVVAGRVTWHGDVTEELRAWARWCALQVVDLWDCPEVVRQYLDTGDAELQVEVRASAASAASAYDAAKTTADAVGSAYDTADAAYAAADAANAAAVGSAHAVDAADDAYARAVNAVYAAAHATDDAAAYADDAYATHAAAQARAALATHLRTLLLRRALPERLWPLIDRVAIDGNARVLCDALLEGHRG